MATIEEVIAEAMRSAVDAFEATGNPAMPDEFQQHVRDALTEIWAASIVHEAEAIESQFKGALPQLETKAAPEFFRRIVQEFIAQYGALKVTQIVDATREQIMRQIAKGTKEGLGVAAIAKTIRENIPEIAYLRASVIARTETHTSSQFGSLASAKESRVPLRKVWVSIKDHRTRDFGEGDGVVDAFNHRAMNGEKSDLDGVFMVPNKYGFKEPMAFPGDPAGSAGNVINCRCAMTYERVSTSYSGL